MGLRMSKVPCMVPWDTNKSPKLDVILHKSALCRLSRSGRVVFSWMGTPCRSLTLSRDPALRTLSSPMGKVDLQWWQADLVTEGNALAIFCCEFICGLMTAPFTCYWALENPHRSFLWLLPAILAIWSLEGVGFVHFAMKAYGTMYLKPTAIMTNMPQLTRLCKPVPGFACPFVLRGMIKFEGVWKFMTALACAYPPQLGVTVGEAVAEGIRVRREHIERGEAVPMIKPEDDMGNPMQQALCDKRGHLLVERSQEWCEDSVPEGDVSGLEQLDEQFEPNSGGAMKGITAEEHMQWAMTLQHQGHKVMDTPIPDDLLEAWKFCAHNPPEVVDARRDEFLAWLKALEKEMEPERLRWFNSQVAEEHKPLLAKVNVPLIAELQKRFGIKDDLLIQHLTRGFPMSGEMPGDIEGVREEEWDQGWSKEEVQEIAGTVNASTLAKVRETEWSGEVHQQQCDDHAEGFSSKPKRLEGLMGKEIHGKCLLSRGIAVREFREGRGERTRTVWHYTESMVNAMIKGKKKTVNETFDYLAWLVINFFVLGIDVTMYKRDIRKAFRFCPVAVDDLDVSWCVWMYQGVIWAAQQFGTHFGAIGSVWAFHRVGCFMASVARRGPKCCVVRYVDDFFGCDPKGIKTGAGFVIDMLSAAIGIMTDGAKSASEQCAMTVLGIYAELQFRQRRMTVQVDEAKAKRWAASCLEVIETAVCDPGKASKCAGRFSSVVTAAFDNTGRAYVRPFYAQQFSPACPVTEWLLVACSWWLRYLQERPKAILDIHWWQREHVLVFTDASGEDRCISAVIYAKGVWKYAWMEVPQQIWDQLIPREDKQIGVTEAMAVTLALETFKEDLAGQRVSFFVDNAGTLAGFIKGASKSTEQNIMIGESWMCFARERIATQFWRVASKANCADGPSRYDFSLMQSVGAIQEAAVLPQYLYRLWEVASEPLL